jgi:hypothetical protein
MALIKAGGLIAEIRGSLGGSVFARNRGGAYVRNRSVGINPQSVDQVRVRQVFSDLAVLWSSTLTESQRDAWEQYAANVPLINPLGEARQVTGLNMYVRSNALLLDTGGTRVDDAPTEFTVGPSFTPTITVDETTDEATVTDLGGYDPATSDVVGLLVQQSPPQSPGVNFFRSPFRKIEGLQVTDLSTDLPATASLAFPVATGQAVFIRTAVVTADGRVGVPVVQRFLT